MTDDNTEIETSDTSLTIRRTFDASRERVFHAFIDPDELAQWFVPDGMTGEVHTLEPELDGAFAMSWIGDETRIENEGTYREFVENERLGWAEEMKGGESRVTIEFEDVDGGTAVVLTHELPGPVAEEAAAGWAGMLDTLAEVL